MTDDDRRLIEAATKARENAHAPYSDFHVGAAVLDENGKIHTGCNVENAAYPLGLCAEANAIGSMIASGSKKIVRIATVGGSQQLDACTPCGGCRQRIREFAEEDTEVLLLGDDGELLRYTVGELLPASFSLPD